MKPQHTLTGAVGLAAILMTTLVACNNTDQSETTSAAATQQETTTPASTPTPTPTPSAINTHITFKQGWTRDEALDFYNTSQGSHLIPYSWFLALEQTDSETLFRDDNHMTDFGYIAQEKLAGRNPDGLPIGFVKDDIKEAFLVDALNKERTIPTNKTDVQTAYNEWLGLTCAACHTSEINYQDYTLRIDGGPSLSDMQSFMKEMSQALTATANNDAKLTRFSQRILAQGGDKPEEKENIKAQLEQYLVWLNGYNSINYDGASPYGYGRLDAFGAILNRVTSSLLDIPANGTPANAPVSFPFLWNTSQLDWVQWNGSADNHIGRNMGEVSGVFAHTILNTTDEKMRFYSSGKIINLDFLENYMSKLDSPTWGTPLPALDQTKVAQGKILFAKNCLSCHGIRDENGQFPMTAANRFGKQFIQTHMTPLQDIGTDPLMAMNFVNPTYNVDPGQMRPYLGDNYKDQEKVPRGAILTVAVANIIQKQMAEISPPLDQQQQLELAGYRDPANTPPNLVAYKARPLNGIWATAPYMHNGSMRNLYQTLLPEEQRESSFHVGGNTFDPVNVGFITTNQGNHFLFETLDKEGKPIPGNSNRGHAGNSYTKTLDDNGQWRDFSDEERYQLIEYMKSL